MRIYIDLCEGRRIYTDFIWIDVRDDGFMWIYMDLLEGRRIYADLYGFMRGATDLCGFILIYTKDHGFKWLYGFM